MWKKTPASSYGSCASVDMRIIFMHQSEPSAHQKMDNHWYSIGANLVPLTAPDYGCTHHEETR